MTSGASLAAVVARSSGTRGYSWTTCSPWAILPSMSTSTKDKRDQTPAELQALLDALKETVDARLAALRPAA